MKFDQTTSALSLTKQQKPSFLHNKNSFNLILVLFIDSEWNLKYSSKHNLQQEQAVFMLTLLKFIVLSETHGFAEIKNKELFMNIQMININCLFPCLMHF
ncbi:MULTISPECIES: hypothetical protein [Acinetobacter]|uniref:Uncharacterized protein n=1 Tax=Acinetobacter baumannii TaxID=470 RepID=A0A098SBQ4_ACIBA|nr:MULTISPECIES: hypothetical protein [Acinetobacter]EYD52726.1 hypothetical protein J917_0858 [Acinetobacter baumannii 25493_4]AJB66017.1 hypothetical protein RU84_03815 [Acinetobacter baumannii]AKQ25893.1 hypothetical protein ACX60_03855 [Acinetobacter baumannii]APP29771.1 hypothetical protein AUO97_02635 [Acinetobacter baumannii]APX48240.1 hypothetical protein AT570_02635 [Acinetobacter baumannii]